MFRWFVTAFAAVLLFSTIWWLVSRVEIQVNQERAQGAQTQPYTGPERRSGEDRRSGDVEQKEVAPYVFAKPLDNVTIYKMVHEGCEIYMSYTHVATYSDNSSIALGRGCK